MTTPSSPDMTKIQELLTILLWYGPITDLVILSHICRDFHYTAKQIICMRLQKCLAPFIPMDNLKLFLHLLKLSRSAIVGSITLAVMSPDPRQWCLEDLNIVLPLGRADQWGRFFNAAGFIRCPVLNNGMYRFTAVNRNIAASVSWFRAPDSVYDLPSHVHSCISYMDENIVIIIKSADDSILLPILSSPSTTQMNFITHNQIFCCYPTLTVNQLALRSYHGDPNHHVAGQRMLTHRQILGLELKNIHLLLGTAMLIGKCGLSCMTITRCFHGFRGIGIFHWAVSGSKADENDEILPDTCLGYEWSLGSACMNSKCENYL